MLLSELTTPHGLYAAVASALVSRPRLRSSMRHTELEKLVHVIFNRYEPQMTGIHALLLVGVPAALSLLSLGHSSVTRAFTLTFFEYWSTLLFSVAVYRLSPWHPLSRYPGPIMLRLSKLSMAWISRGGKRHVYTQDLHRRYGDIVRVGACPRLHFPQFAMVIYRR